MTQVNNLKNLTCTLITSDLDLNTPKCVISEIIKICRAEINLEKLDDKEYRKKVIYKINNYTNFVDIDLFLNCLNLNDTIFLKTIKKIASFINPDVSWSLNTLKLAFNHLVSFSDKNSKFDISNDVQFGLQTLENPNNLNNCVCLCLCKKYNINFTYNTTESQMYNHIKLISQPENLKKFLYNNINDSKLLINMYSNFCNTLKQNNLNDQKLEINPNNLTIAYNKFKNINKQILFRIGSYTVEESITIAILIYDIDISYCNDPISELLNLNLWKDCDIWINKNFNLIDPKVNIIFKLNPNLFKFNSNFNPIFPNNFYINNKLIQIYDFETKTNSINRTDIIINSYYAELQCLILCNSFHHGFHLGITNTETEFFKENLYECKNNDIVCYGIKNNIMTAYLYRELDELFNCEMNFNLPDKCVLDTYAINKLISLCNIEQNESKIELLKTINDIKLFNDSKGKMMKEFYTYYMNTANKDLILECTQSLLYLGFRMRGWLDGKDFPVKIAMVDNQAVVDLNVQEALISFEINCKKLGTDSYVIKSFPLMKYNKGFHFSNNTEDGKTVGERIELVKKGEDTQNMGSCMRLSSNYIVTTAHKMYTTLKLKEPFDIKLLRNIS
jgi:hypothetical protein